MERLTLKAEENNPYIHGKAYVTCNVKGCLSITCEANPPCERMQEVVDRLYDFENIFGDDYDLDRLRCAVENLADAEARADEAEAAMAAAVRDMEAMALTIRQRRDHDTECCPFCKYDCPEEDYCPGWEGEECFQWRGK